MGVSMQALACASLIASAPAWAAPPTPAPPAPAPPAISVAARTFVAFAGQPAPVKLAWPAAANVARYRARWTDAGTLVDIELPGTATAFERAVATPGRHHLSVVAIDATGRESRPTEVAVEVVAITAIAPGASEPAFPASGAFAIGARFSSEGLACQLGGGDRATEVTATVPGPTTLRCTGDGRGEAPRVEVPLVIAPIVVAGPKTPLVRGRLSTIHITVASVAQLGERLDAVALGDLSLGETRRTHGGFEVDVAIAPGAATAGIAIQSHATELGRIELALAAPPSAPGERIALALEGGAHAGVLVPPQLGDGGTWLGRPTNPMHAIASVPFVGGRVALFPTPRVGIEAEAAIGMSGYVGQPGLAAVLLTRAQLAVRVVEDLRAGLRVLAGADVYGILSERGTSHRDAAGAVHYGAAVTVATRRDLSLRIQALHVIAQAPDAGFAHCLELQLGVMTRVGRRDHGW